MIHSRAIRLILAAATLTVLAGTAGRASAARAGHTSRASLHASDILVYGSTRDPDTLNPLMMTLVAAFDIDGAVFDGLLAVDGHGGFHPDLATSWSISKDNLTYTFHLRHGVRWADGAPFTAKDVVFTYQQEMNPKNQNYSSLGWDHITSVQTPDPYTVIFHTKKVFATFLEYVGWMSGAGIIPAHYFAHSSSFRKAGNYNQDPFDRTPFGTGPYRVTEWKSADHITLAPNPYYWGPKPSFKKIVVKIVPNENTLLVELRTGEVDFAEVGQQQANLARSIPGRVLLDRPGNTWYHIDLKQWSFLRDQQVRVALDYATPKDEIVQKVLNGYGQPAYGDISPLNWAYNPNVPRHSFDLKKAAAILAADGFAKGSDGYLQKNGQELYIQLWYSSDDTAGAQIDLILKYLWGQIGVKVDLHHQDAATIYSPTGPQFTKQMTGISYGWTNNPDPDDSIFWNSAQIPATPSSAGQNVLAYFYKFSFQNQIDNLTNQGVATLDRGKRKAIYAQIETLLAQQTPVIFLYWEPLLYSVPPGLKGFDTDPVNDLFYNAYRWHY